MNARHHCDRSTPCRRWGATWKVWLAGLVLFGAPFCGSLLPDAQAARFGGRTASAAAGNAWPANSFAVICYHDIRDDRLEDPDSYTVETRNLALQFAWLRAHDYHVISLEELIQARMHHLELPPRAVLISFDDGLESVYSRAFPLLRAFQYPAIVGLVGSWLESDGTPGAKVRYGDTEVARSNFVTTDQIHEMLASGLIEIGSHSYAAHTGVPGNPQENLEPAVVTRQFNKGTGAYEDEAQYEARVRDDLSRNNAALASLTGRSPRVIVWPYGAHNRAADSIAQGLGMPYGLTLELGLNTPDVPLSRMRRILVTHDFTTADLARALEEPDEPEALRVIQVDLDYVFDPDPRQQESNLSALLDRVKSMGVNAVFLQAYADPEGTGTARALYFPNRRLPMRADLFNRVAWQLRTRCGVAVYAWLPLLAFDLPADDAAHDHWVEASDPVKAGDVKRLSPFDPLVRQAVRDIYTDLSTYTEFQGLLFSDDATLNDFEDASPEALRTYRQWGLPGDVSAIRADPRLLAQWSARKTGYLTQFSIELAALVAADHENIDTARNLFASVVTQPQSEQWLAQSLPEALAAYDHVALMAMPYLEEERAAPGPWLKHLVVTVGTQPQGLNKTIFELQSVDWAHHNQPIPGTTLAEQLALLKRAGARHFGYYPDDFVTGRPSLELLRPVLSLKAFPGND